MSYDAIRWAMGQPVVPAMTKFLLVAMADCVNAEAGEMVCWPSYAYLARRTGMNTKTVEVGVCRLKQEGYLVDTGKRAGDTSKVVVYRLNDPKSGVVTPGPQSPSANGTRPHNDPETGAIGTTPKAAANPPKSGPESPQKVEEIPPKQGAGTSKGTRNRTQKEPGKETACAAVSDLPESLVAEWQKVRNARRAGPVGETVIEVLDREAARAGLSRVDAVRYCVGAGWQNFTATYWASREGVKLPAASHSRRPTSHAGLADKDYHQGVTPDGTLA